MRAGMKFAHGGRMLCLGVTLPGFAHHREKSGRKSELSPISCQKSLDGSSKQILPSAPGAEAPLGAPAQAQGHAQVPQAAEAAVGAGLAAIGAPPLLQGGEDLLIQGVVWFHGDGAADVLQSGDPVAGAVVGQGAEVVPLAVPGLGPGQGVEGLLEAAILNVA